jgi:hypothetical protein
VKLGGKKESGKGIKRLLPEEGRMRMGMGMRGLMLTGERAQLS